MLFPPVGTSVTLLVHVSGNPVPLPSDIQWYRNNVLIDNMDASLILSLDRTQLMISNIMSDYYGIYQCKVSTSAGTRYHNITITQPRKCHHLYSNTIGTLFCEHTSSLILQLDYILMDTSMNCK